jgi:hypothetical protein
MSKHTSKTYSIFSHLGYCPECGAKEDPTNVKAQRDELLEALKAITALYETDEGCRSLPEYISARAAIAKATGGQA